MNSDRFVFFGTGGLLSSICLKKLIEANRMPVLTVIQGKTDSIYPNLTLQLANQHNLDVELCSALNEDLIEKILSISPDYAVMASFGIIIKEPLLSTFPIINVHMGVLPEFRGPVTNFWKILNGDDIFGATIHEISAEIDGGNILKIVEKDYSSVTGATDFFHQNYKMAAEALLDVLNNRKNIMRIPIDTAKGKYYPKFTEKDLIIDATAPVAKLQKIMNRLQFYGNPTLSGLKITNASLLLSDTISGQKPEIISIDNTKSIFKNGTGILLLDHLPIDYLHDS